jgi:hypothetical protein
MSHPPPPETRSATPCPTHRSAHRRRGVDSNAALSGDANGDNIVDGADLSVLLANFGGAFTGAAFGDFNSNGIVDGEDLSILLARFGNACS